MDIKVVNDEEQEVSKETTEPVETKILVDGEPFIYNQLGQMFDMLPSEVNMMKDKLEVILEYAKTQVTEQTMENIKWAIRDLSSKVGTPPLGEKLVNYLSKYAYLNLERINLEKDIKKYERN